jgi:hypothetical protein
MKLAKIGTGLGFGMIALGAVGRITGGAAPKKDPMGAYIDEVSGSLIVFGAALTFASFALTAFSKSARFEKE